jgi:hypothetical protein
MKLNKNLIKEFIKSKIRKIIKEEQEQIQNDAKSKYLVQRLPPLRRALELLLSKAYENFITNVQLEAPKPATFKVVLTNGLEFYLIYNGGKDNEKFDLVNATFIAKIAGRNYDLASMSQSQQAMQKLSQQLTLSPAPVGESKPTDNGEEAFNDMDSEPSLGTSSSSGIDDLPLPAESEPGEEELEIPDTGKPEDEEEV